MIILANPLRKLSHRFQVPLIRIFSFLVDCCCSLRDACEWHHLIQKECWRCWFETFKLKPKDVPGCARSILTIHMLPMTLKLLRLEACLYLQSKQNRCPAGCNGLKNADHTSMSINQNCVPFLKLCWQISLDLFHLFCTCCLWHTFYPFPYSSMHPPACYMHSNCFSVVCCIMMHSSMW